MTRSKYFFSPVYLLILIVSLSFLNSYANDQLHFLSEENAPYNFTVNGRAQGIAVDILEEVLRRMNYPFDRKQILFFPWSRSYREALLGNQKSIIFTIALTKEREKLFQLVGPFTAGKSVVFSLNPAREIKKIDELFTSKIAVIRDDISKYRLLSQGFPLENIVEVTDKEQLFSMLKKKRVDYFSHGELTTYYALKENHTLKKDDLKIVYVNQQGPLYFGFSNNVDKKFVARFQKVISEVLADKQFIKSVNLKYI